VGLHSHHDRKTVRVVLLVNQEVADLAKVFEVLMVLGPVRVGLDVLLDEIGRLPFPRQPFP
jgi:hypothetical protein